jgi:hypothetical protein
MTDDGCRPVFVSRRIEAPASTVFELLTDPSTHPGIDGSGMVKEAASTSVISGVGAVFAMRMYNTEMGDYEITNHVVEYELNRRVGWEPVLSAASRAEDAPDIGHRAGHRWIYELTAVGPNTTIVTETFDCCRAPEWLRKAVDNGNRWVQSMTTTLEKLDRKATTK